MRVGVQESLNTASNSLRDKSTKGDNGGKELGKQDFLNLMMTQMARQDPMSPMDTDKMMSQMSALGTVEQLQNLNAQVAKLSAVQGDIAKSSVYSFLDKDVELGTNKLAVSGGREVDATFNLAGDADKVFAYITNQEGQNVRVIELGARGPGMHGFTWDGKDDDGDQLSDGSYKFDVIAKTKDGETVTASTFKRGRVSEVSFDGDKPMIKVNQERFGLGDIQSVGVQSAKQFDGASLMPLKKDLSVKNPHASAQSYERAKALGAPELSGPAGIKTTISTQG